VIEEPLQIALRLPALRFGGFLAIYWMKHPSKLDVGINAKDDVPDGAALADRKYKTPVDVYR